ncbi:PREDICTED: uncharacterized protein LOC109340309, partial [Lupinus angustifolius]|uniref:uncharacterized protein LOC109340309 n=1 Tax=Lupinus angustifolius TaxID=3871 RepID=UPI00092E472F
MNKASFTKLAWDMRTTNHEWAEFYINMFGCNSIPSSRYFKSSIWPGIRDNWELYNMNSIWVLNIPQDLHKDLHATVTDFTNGSKWTKPTLLANFCPKITDQIARANR